MAAWKAGTWPAMAARRLAACALPSMIVLLVIYILGEIVIPNIAASYMGVA